MWMKLRCPPIGEWNDIVLIYSGNGIILSTKKVNYQAIKIDGDSYFLLKYRWFSLFCNLNFIGV